jgi:predicted nucleotidyltransferase component of viral defense system
MDSKDCGIVALGELTPGQREVLRAVAQSSLASDFYLSGGTALRIAYLHHRTSLDLDFFSRLPLRAEAVMTVFRQAGIEIRDPSRVYDRWQFTAAAAGEAIRVEFVHYAFDRVAPADLRIDALEVDSIRDILANKLSALIDRCEPKDYADVLLLLRSGASLDRGIADCRAKFGWPAIDVLLQQAFARAAILTEWPELEPPVALSEAKAEFRELARRLIVLPET